eukprot:7854701-Pyramimonas_sp.AAC.1
MGSCSGRQDSPSRQIPSMHAPPAPWMYTQKNWRPPGWPKVVTGLQSDPGQRMPGLACPVVVGIHSRVPP